MLAISSNEELVSSSEAACSLAPSAKLWLAEETWLAAATICSVPVATEFTTPPRMALVRRTRKPLVTRPSSKVKPPTTIRRTRVLCTSAASKVARCAPVFAL